MWCDFHQRDWGWTAMHAFSDFISTNGLVGIPLEGGEFTWSNNREMFQYLALTDSFSQLTRRSDFQILHINDFVDSYLITPPL
jgi:hypothetical protein